MHVRIPLPVVAESRQGAGNGILAVMLVKFHSLFSRNMEANLEVSKLN